MCDPNLERVDLFASLMQTVEDALGVRERAIVAAVEAHDHEYLVEQVSGGEWVERAPYFEAIAVNGDGVFDTLKAVSKLVLKALA